MFKQARFRLTVMYTLIIMLISVFFSILVYRALTDELTRIERMHDLRQQRFESGNEIETFPPFPFQTRDRMMRLRIDPELIAETKQRLIVTLGFVNLIIVFAAGAGGYFLSGRTLRPIQKMVDSQKRFVSDASHELRTPLTAMRTELEVALLDDLSPQQSRELILSNIYEITQLQELVDNLLTLSKGHSDEIIKRFSNVNLLDVVEDALKKVIPKARSKNIEIENEVDSLIVFGDATSLTQVIVILLDNALKYSDPGKLVRVYAEQVGKSIKLIIEDQGCGIADKDLPHVFDRFYRSDESRIKNNGSGYGLGLSIAKKLVELHGGNIGIQSEAGKGTKVLVSFGKISGFEAKFIN